ncbi:MAG: esterase family protein [Lachnospiraceae bacterium]|nr:esterase family protein [Lachnospiraceae bacterium]
MKETYQKHYSEILGRDMEYLTFGESGKLCIAFPPQNGRFHDFKDFGMVDCVKDWVEAGKIRIVCPDGIDGETWSNKEGNPRARIELQEKWFHYIVDEFLPAVRVGNEKAMVTGCSMGGVHAGNFFFRRPDLFDVMISLSGLFNAQYFFGDYMDDLVYDNSPVHFLPNMPADHPWMKLYRESTIILCVGQGAWEDDLLYGTRVLDTILAMKEIPHWADYWGYDVAHDWPWWRKQLPYFLEKILG